MDSIAFIDTEIDPVSRKVLDIGGIRENQEFHSNSNSGFIKFLQGSRYICGHNILNHDLKYIHNEIRSAGINNSNIIDTLFISPLMFPARPYHSLLKDDKLQTEDVNNPLNDSKKARDLFYDEVASFKKTDRRLKQIYYFLLKDKKEFASFFNCIGYQDNELNKETIIELIYEMFNSQICENANLPGIILENQIALAYCLALINAQDRYSITPPWVLKNFPDVERIMFLLRNNPCITGCVYCNEALDIHKALKRYFGFDSFRTYAGEPLQQKAAKAAVDNKSLLAVFPTGGGKSITFQLPALMGGVNQKGLTVVISPLQSLMKDQVDNLERAGITEAVTINGLLDPIERAKSYERVENGSAHLLYISPESLRSISVERLLLGRNVVRFVIDEAHCFSSWGQDFRVDYLYIGDFINEYQKKKNLGHSIPVSCFTATAKPKVIEDIREYFKEKLSCNLEVFSSRASRSNLRYKVLQKNNEQEKHNAVRDLLDEKKCPTIIYVTRTKRAEQLAKRLTEDGYTAKPYHGQMDKQVKSENQDLFIKGEIKIMVATSAFGMGVDKKDVGMVIHYDISDSLENYIQEAGRAGRDENIQADCYVLFNDEDLGKHFILLNRTKLSIKEIQQVWKAIKGITRFRLKVSQSALEIARKAGWDENMSDVETRVKTAVAALEDAGYLKRGQNMPRVFADSILVKNAAEAIYRIENSQSFTDSKKQQAIRIMRNLISSKNRKSASGEEAETRVDYISDRLAIPKEEVIQIINLLREERILADNKDLIAYIKKTENKNRSLAILKSFWNIEKFLITKITREQKEFNIKELNELAAENGYENVTPEKIKTIMNFWAIKTWIKKITTPYSKNHISASFLYGKDVLNEKFLNRYQLAEFILEYLYERSHSKANGSGNVKDEVLVEFSVVELKEAYEKKFTLLNTKTTLAEIEDALFYLSKIDALNIEGGFLVIYNGMSIERIETDNKKRYKVQDYERLNQFYENKVQQVHIVGEYAKKMISDYKDALQFVDDYFRLNYVSFLNKYFKGSRQDEIKKNITPAKFKELFGELSPSQLSIINDRESQYIVVAAGPGSGKTRVLVHKLASLVYMEDVKQEQMLMLTFSRAAATEFKKRLLKLIGNAATFVEIKTFHSYCFDLLGRLGTIEKSDEIIKEAAKRIHEGEVDAGRITKTVLVIDEAQDMDSYEFELINALMKYNEEMRLIAVGDDDQNIFEFRGSSSKYLEKLIKEKKAVKYELIQNYRSKSNIVDFTNQLVRKIKSRLKEIPIVAEQHDNGKIKVIRYRSQNLVVPVVRDILSCDLVGNTCVLTTTNEDALHITGLLTKSGLPSKLIQTNEGFNLYNLLEVRSLMNRINLGDNISIIDDEAWENAKHKLKDTFTTSPNWEICNNVINEFEKTNPRYKYKSDLDVFIRESKLEDFYDHKLETIYVSTIHKAKGREFDNVFLMLDQRFNIRTDEAIRQLYVAMTRAKQNLTIYYNGNYLGFIKTDNLQNDIDTNRYQLPEQLTMLLTHKDVWLDFFELQQPAISQLNSGDELAINGYSCYNSKGRPVLKFSKQYINLIENMKQKSYILENAVIKFIIYWKKEGSEHEIRIILPEVYFKYRG